MNNKLSLSLIAVLLILCIYLSQQALYWHGTAELRSKTADRWCDKYEEEVANEDKTIPQWFIDEFNQTFVGSYSIRIEDDKLNIVIITTGKKFNDLRQFIEGDNRNWQSGYIGGDIAIDVMEWEYIIHDDDNDDGEIYGIIVPGMNMDGDAE